MSDINEAAVVDALRAHIVRELLPGEDPANLTSDRGLKEQGVLDSLAMLKLISFVERTYAIEIEPEEAASAFGTIDQIAALVVRKSAR